LAEADQALAADEKFKQESNGALHVEELVAKTGDATVSRSEENLFHA